MLKSSPAFSDIVMLKKAMLDDLLPMELNSASFWFMVTLLSLLSFLLFA
jgi:hypothetical protein